VEQQKIKKHYEAGKIVSIYILFGFVWIYFSDTALGWFVRDPELITKIAIFKGLLFITITSVLLFFLIARLSGRIRRSTKALQESEERLDFLVKNSSDSLIIIGADGSQRYVSPAAERITGFPVGELEGRALDTVIHPDDMKDIQAAWNEAVKHPEKSVTVQCRHIHKTREWVFTEAIAQSFLDDPAINGIIASVRDITEHKRMETTLREKSEELERYFLLSMDLLCIANTSGEFIRVNPEWERVLGYSSTELNGRSFLEFVHPEDMDGTLKAVSSLKDQQEVMNFENRYRRKDGTYRWIEWRSRPRGDLIYAVARDITERKQAENALQESEDKFRLTFNFSPDAVNINRLEDGLYVDINEAYTRITGFTREDVRGKTSLEINIWQEAADRQRLVQGLREKGYVENLEAQFRRKDGSLVTGLMSARIVSLKGVPHIISISRDITERKKHENEQLKIEKLESLGILAGGIAHDFNNILTGVIGNISFAMVFLDAAHKAYKPLAEAEKAAARAGELAHQLLTFARGGEPIKKVVSPRRLVDEALSFILHGSNVKGIIDIPDSIHTFEADEGQISQVLQNIIINATQAMPGGGILTVAARNEVLTDNNALSLPPGSYIRLTCVDQGCGISNDILKRIFDPYFTTKSAGIGLGLSSVHSIVCRHGGHIGVESVIGKGTNFTIHLPSMGKAEEQADATVQLRAEHRGGCILVMDDDQMVKDIAMLMLTHLGYEVTVCAEGEGAVELYTASVESGTPFSMVIMDLTIPGGLGGKQAAERILSRFPKACLVVSSGYSNDPIMSNYREYGFSGVIAKPYTLQNFKEVLSSLLSA
jgi:two-component system, cell cycle sensor histidine kinase and response regulator CckA